MVKNVDEQGNSILQAALVLPIAALVFLCVLQVGSVMAQVSTLNASIESAIAVCDFSQINADIDKNAALASQIGQGALMASSANISVSNTCVEEETQSNTALADRNTDQIFTVDQTVTKAHLTADLNYDVSLFIDIFGTDSIRLNRHIDAWQTTENDVRFSEE